MSNQDNLWVGRDNGVLRDTGFGNPNKIGIHGTRADVLEAYLRECIPQIRVNPKLMTRLRSAKQICCACKVTDSCHGGLLELSVMYIA